MCGVVLGMMKGACVGIRHQTSEHAYHALQPGYESIDFRFRVVEGERGPCHAFHAATCHQRLCTMVSRADGDAEAVEQGAEVHGMDVCHVEGHYGGLFGGIS